MITKQDNHSKQTSGGLKVERGNVVGKRAHDAHGNCQVTRLARNAQARAQCDGSATVAARAGHARSDRGEDENALRPSRKSEDADVEDGDAAGGVRACGIR